MFLDEVRCIDSSEVKLLPHFSFDTYVKSAADGARAADKERSSATAASPTSNDKAESADLYYTSDFVVGNKLSFGTAPLSQRDRAEKTFILTEVDLSYLKTRNDEQKPGNDASVRMFLVSHRPQLSSAVVTDVMAVRDAFIRQAGGSSVLGIKEIGKKFRHIDNSGARKVNLYDFERAVEEAHVELSPERVKGVFAAFDTERKGSIDFDEFLSVIRGPMSEQRKKIVADAFRKIDSDQDGFVTLHDLELRFNANGHPEVLSGDVSESQVKSAFLSQWDTREKHGKVTLAEFMDYYNGISASVDNDEMFVTIVAHAWNLE